MTQQQRENATKTTGKATGEKETAAERTDSGAGGRTMSAAAEARVVMQRRHLRAAFGMTASVGLEIAGAAGLIGGGFLPWEWGARLWGATSQAGVITQAALALTVLTLLIAWLGRSERLRVRLRVVALGLATALVVALPVWLWQVEPGGRGAGALVAALGALLVLPGIAGWLVGLRRLRKLFPFGLAQAQTRGFGNLVTVRRAQLSGVPVGALLGALLVAASWVLVPGWVGTVDSRTAAPLAFTDEPPASAGGPNWTITLPITANSRVPQVWATDGGLVIEERTGVQGVDPRTGEERWHWRDEVYERRAGVLTDSGRTVVLAMEHQDGGRDKVVALDTATGEPRWERYDDDLVRYMEVAAVAPREGDWFAVPERDSAPEAQQQPTAVLWVVGSDGELRHRLSAEEGCGYSMVNPDPREVLITGQQCQGEHGPQPCHVTGVDPATGEERWGWPPADLLALDCQINPTEELVVVRYLLDGERHAVVLDQATGEPGWRAGPEELAGLTGPQQAGDVLVGIEQAETATLVIREAADGTVREQVPSSSGQPIGLLPVNPQRMLMSSYLLDSAELALTELDPATGELGETTPVASSPPEATLTDFTTIVTGPSALVVYTIVADGLEPGPDDYRLLVHGW